MPTGTLFSTLKTLSRLNEAVTVIFVFSVALHVSPALTVQPDQVTDDPGTSGVAVNVTDDPAATVFEQVPEVLPEEEMLQFMVVESVIVPPDVPAGVPEIMSVMVEDGVTLFDGAEAGPVPIVLVAVTVNV